MTRRKKTDGERIAFKARIIDSAYEVGLARDIDRLLRKRMAEAWEEGWFDRDCHEADWDKNPYRERKRNER